LIEPKLKRLHKEILGSLQAAIDPCGPVPSLPNFRRPSAKIPIQTLFSDFNDRSGPYIFDELVEDFPWGLPSDQLIHMEWNGVLSSAMGFDAIRLNHKTTLYFEFNDYEGDSPYFIAVAEAVSAKLAHETFLHELFTSNGATFHTAIFGSPPEKITSVFPRAKLVEPFLAAAQGAHYGCDDFWEEVLQVVSRRRHGSKGIDVSTELGRRKAIEAYLAVLLP
jgi:hypothetical protein